MKIILTLKAILNYLKKLGNLFSGRGSLTEIKTLISRNVQIGWAYICTKSLRFLNKNEIPSLYEYISSKLLNIEPVYNNLNSLTVDFKDGYIYFNGETKTDTPALMRVPYQKFNDPSAYEIYHQYNTPVAKTFYIGDNIDVFGDYIDNENIFYAVYDKEGNFLKSFGANGMNAFVNVFKVNNIKKISFAIEDPDYPLCQCWIIEDNVSTNVEQFLNDCEKAVTSIKWYSGIYYCQRKEWDSDEVETIKISSLTQEDFISASPILSNNDFALLDIIDKGSSVIVASGNKISYDGGDNWFDNNKQVIPTTNESQLLFADYSGTVYTTNDGVNYDRFQTEINLFENRKSMLAVNTKDITHPYAIVISGKKNDKSCLCYILKNDVYNVDNYYINNKVIDIPFTPADYGTTKIVDLDRDSVINYNSKLINQQNPTVNWVYEWYRHEYYYIFVDFGSANIKICKTKNPDDSSTYQPYYSFNSVSGHENCFYIGNNINIYFAIVEGDQNVFLITDKNNNTIETLPCAYPDNIRFYEYVKDGKNYVVALSFGHGDEEGTAYNISDNASDLNIKTVSRGIMSVCCFKEEFYATVKGDYDTSSGVIFADTFEELATAVYAVSGRLMIVACNNNFIMASDNSGKGKKSYDGINWENISSSLSGNFTPICTGDSQRIWFAIGDNGIGISTDGNNFESVVIQNVNARETVKGIVNNGINYFGVSNGSGSTVNYSHVEISENNELIDKLTELYNYLGYLPYWAVNSDGLYPIMNSKPYTVMYVGDNYKDSTNDFVLPVQIWGKNNAVICDMESTDIVLSPQIATTYSYGTLTSLQINNLPENIDNEVNLFFTTGDTFQWSAYLDNGTNLVPNNRYANGTVIPFEPNTQYAVTIFNGLIVGCKF